MNTVTFQIPANQNRRCSGHNHHRRLRGGASGATIDTFGAGKPFTLHIMIINLFPDWPCIPTAYIADNRMISRYRNCYTVQTIRFPG